MAPPVLHRVIYGTTSPEPWQKALTTVYPALLQNFSRHKVRYADYPGILPTSNPSSAMASDPKAPLPSVRGSLVTGLLDEDVRRLDIFEGDQYTRNKVKVLVLKSNVGLDQTVDEHNLFDFVESEVEAETYVWTADPEELEKEAWDFEEFRREKMWAWVGEPQRGFLHDSDSEPAVDVEVDEGFADVDRDVEERKKQSGKEGKTNNMKDPTGGRGLNGHITKELEAAQAGNT